jgi:hypothetical protein
MYYSGPVAILFIEPILLFISFPLTDTTAATGAKKFELHQLRLPVCYSSATMYLQLGSQIYREPGQTAPL